MQKPRGRIMRISLFQQILKQIPWRQFRAIVEKHEGDKWCKKFTSRQQLIAMLFAQFSDQDSLRDVVASFNADPARHYHLGAAPLARSTLSQANAKRPVAIFEDLLKLLIAKLIDMPSGEAKEALRLIDSTVISLSAKMHKWAPFRANNAALKLHLVLDPDAECPTFFEIASARLHDSTLAKSMPIDPGNTYVFDRAYNDSAFWKRLDDADCSFVTRAKSNLLLDVIERRHDPADCIVFDDIVDLAGRGKKNYQKPLRRITFWCEKTERELVFLTNDFDREATEIAALYKRRWDIELFFKWIKQNLELKRFMANNENGVRLQIITSLIAYIALKLLHTKARIKAPLKRLMSLAKNTLHNQSAMIHLLSPKNREPPDLPTNQLILNFPGQ